MKIFNLKKKKKKSIQYLAFYFSAVSISPSLFTFPPQISLVERFPNPKCVPSCTTIYEKKAGQADNTFFKVLIERLTAKVISYRKTREEEDRKEKVSHFGYELVVRKIRRGRESNPRHISL